MSDTVDARPSFSDVYREHFAFLWRVVAGLGVPPEATEDIVHDVFVAVHRRLPGYDPEQAPLRSWLYGIARRVASRHHRGRQRRERRHRALPEPGPVETPEVQAGRREAAEAMQRFVDELDDDKREVFVMTELQGMTAREIGAALQISANTVSSRLRAARQQFAAFVQRRLEGGDGDG